MKKPPAELARIAANDAGPEETAPRQDVFRTLAENTSDMIMHVRLLPFPKLVYVNPACFDITGYTPEELYNLSGTPADGGYPEQPPIFRELMNPHRACGIKPVEIQWTKKDGTKVWTEQTKTVIRDEHGAPVVIYFICRDMTKRKMAESALQESEERFSKAFHSSPGSIAIINLSDARFIEVNDSFLRDKGFTREEVIGKTAREMGLWVDENDSDRIRNIIREKGRVTNELVRYRTKSGDRRTGYFSADTIRLGSEPCLIIQTTDITRQKQAEDRSRLLGSITERVSDCTIVTDTDFNITYMNTAAIKLLGYSLKEARGRKLSLFNEKPLSKREMAEALKTLSAGKTLNQIARKRRRDGTILICDCRISPLFDEKGGICSYIYIQHDITGQQETEANLQINKQMVEGILAAMPEGVLVIDNRDNVVLANKAFYRIFRLNRRSVMNRPLRPLFPISQLHTLYRNVKRGQEKEATLEFRYRKGDVDKIIVSVITSMENSRTLLTFSDVSRDREEEEKLYLTDRLASIGEMATGLVHELNNPLTGILALSQMLLEDDLPEESREDISCIYDEAKRAASIVKNVLLFTRNNNYEHGRSSANEVIKDILRLREHEAQTSRITVVADLEKDLPEIPIDRYQLQQVILNMILNAEAAIKATDRPGTLTVTTERQNGHINIILRDNGCGINKSVLPRIFDPFFSTKDIGEGTGLGLSICYGITVKHGGKISVKTRVNEGTAFTIAMPAVTAKETKNN